MASKTISASLATFLTLNLLFFCLVTACQTCCPSHKPKPKQKCKPKPTPSPSPPPSATCPIDALKFGVCANVLSGLLNVTIGTPPKEPCCTLIQGLADLEAAICLCTAIKAKILGINLNVPLSLSLLLNYCGLKVPRGFRCP